MPPGLDPRRSARRAAAVLLVLVAAWGAHHRSLSAAFLSDDVEVVRDNPRLRLTEDGDLADLVASPYWSGPGRDLLWRPLALASFALQWQDPPLPFPFHAANLALHAAVSLALLFVGRRLGAPLAVAAAAALLFAVHPLASEAVTLVVGRADLLAALFSLLALGWIATPGPVSYPGLAAGAACAALAGFSKENGFCLPIIAAALLFTSRPDRSAAGRSMARGSAAARLAAISLPLLGVLALRHDVLGQWARAGLPPLENNPLAHAPALAGRLEALRLMARGAALFLWPFPLQAEYGFAATVVPPVDFVALLSVGAGVGAAVLLLGLAWRRPITAAGAVLFLAGQILTANVMFPIGTAFAERLLYLPLAGLSLAAADLAWAGLSRCRPRLARGVGIAAGLGLIAALAMVTARRERDYADDLTYWRSAAATAPASARARYNHGRSLAERGDQTAARVEYEAAVTIYERAPVPTPGHPLALNNLGTTLLRQGESAEARLHLERAAALAPASAEVAMNLALVLHAAGREAEARASFARGAVLDAALARRLLREGGTWSALAGGAAEIPAPPPDLTRGGSPPPP